MSDTLMEDQPLSPKQVESLTLELQQKMGLRDPQAYSVVAYDRIIHSPDLDSIFGNKRALIIFYPYANHNNMTMGHYTCIIKNPMMKKIFYYDSLAYKPDQYKKFSPQRNELYPEQHNTLISHLLEVAHKGYEIDFNHRQHQSRKSTVSTCGRHVAMRCTMVDLSNDQYHRELLKVKRKIGDTKGKLMDSTIMRLTTL